MNSLICVVPLTTCRGEPGKWIAQTSRVPTALRAHWLLSVYEKLGS